MHTQLKLSLAKFNGFECLFTGCSFQFVILILIYGPTENGKIEKYNNNTNAHDQIDDEN